MSCDVHEWERVTAKVDGEATYWCPECGALRQEEMTGSSGNLSGVGRIRKPKLASDSGLLWEDMVEDSTLVVHGMMKKNIDNYGFYQGDDLLRARRNNFYPIEV